MVRQGSSAAKRYHQVECGDSQGSRVGLVHLSDSRLEAKVTVQDNGHNDPETQG